MSNAAPLPSIGLNLQATGGSSGSSGAAAPLPSMGLLFSLTGNKYMGAEMGTYAWTGSEVLADYSLLMGQGTYNYAGSTLFEMRLTGRMTMDMGSYGINGQAVSLLVGYKMPCVQGGYSQTGYAVTTIYSIIGGMPASAGYYVNTGNDVGMLKATRMPMEYGTYAAAGQFVDFFKVEKVTEIVPYLIGSTRGPAEVKIIGIHCIADVIGSEGTVTSQSPVHMTEVERGSTVTITLGGPENNPSGGKRRRGAQNYNAQVN